ncbi:MAG: alpha/beta hydrolase [Ardenticatenaceae bacterium]|nr:alpha/beta hydrolase [Anaerolineales bacterium]MCB8921369.1 alpha/beta hydrolase [Ardenticatenaceae bacterium]MCB8991491.1 alpha/beta hydrolase [Ardenticatenaceae bacterium]MCB9004007.1 alpha/beta hydrolase [Ardenticatenaceae bacterium]
MTNWTTDDGTLINFETYGGGPGREVVLLLPGLLGSISTQWRNFVKPLSVEFAVIMMDLRGHGRSENKAPNLQPERIVQDIVGLLDFLEVSRIHVVGYDFGGYLGLMLALNQPRRVQSLIMHATKFYWTEDAAKKMRTQLDPDKMAEDVPAYADQLVQEHGGRRWRELVRQAADLVAYLAQKGLTENMAAQVQCPALISLGDRDEMVSLVEAQRLSRVIRRGGLFVLPGTRHPYHSTLPIPMLPMMEYFVKSSLNVR